MTQGKELEKVNKYVIKKYLKGGTIKVEIAKQIDMQTDREREMINR